MTEKPAQPTATIEQQRIENLRYARAINSYWRERGVEAHARVRVRSLRLALEDGSQKTVRSAEIVSGLAKMMNTALALARVA